MRDVERLDVQTLGLGVALGVGEQVQEEHGALVGPATLSHLELLGLSIAADISLLWCVKRCTRVSE